MSASAEIGGAAASAPSPTPGRGPLLGALTLAEVRAAVRRVWLAPAVGLGLVLIVVATVVAATHSGVTQDYSFRSNGASLLLIGGLFLAAMFGATLVNRDANSGHMGLLVAAGAGRTCLTLARTAARGGLLVLALVAWAVAIQVGGAVVGRGFDGPLAVHSLASILDMVVVFLAAGLASAGFGPVSSGIAGVIAHVATQAFANLDAAGDVGAIGSTSRPIMGALYAVFPRAIESPMIVDLQVRGEASAAAPQFEINGNVVPIPASDALDVLWTLGWCGLVVGLICLAMRRRTL